MKQPRLRSSRALKRKNEESTIGSQPSQTSSKLVTTKGPAALIHTGHHQSLPHHCGHQMSAAVVVCVGLFI